MPSRRVLAKPLGINVDYRQEPDKDDYATLIPDHVDPYFEEEPTAKEFLLQFKPTRAGAARYIKDLFPFWNWIFHYNLQWLTGDIIAGVTVGFVVVPQGMAYALLAKLSPEYGLYTSFVGFLLYWAFATSKDITIGTVAVMSTIVGNIVIKVQDKHPDIPAEQVARCLSLISGAILLFIGLIRAGWIVEFIPLVAITSFMTGAAFSIAVGQVPAMMGISGINTREATYLVLINTLKKLGSTKIDAALGLSALFALYFIRWVCNTMSEKQPHRKKMWFFLSTLRMAFIILLYTMASWLSNRGISNAKEAKFKILGTVPRGFQHAGAPHVDARLIRAFSSELPAAIIVLLIEHIAISKSFGRINNYTIDPSQELVALGFTNVFGPFLGGYPATGSFSRTAIKSKAGVRTPLAGIFTAVLVLLALYALTSVFFYIPMATLAGLIIHAVGDLITPPDVVYRFYQISPLEVIIFFAGVLVTVFTNIENGIYTAIAASAAVLLFRHARAKGLVLGHIKVHYLTDAEFARQQQQHSDPADAIDRHHPPSSSSSSTPSSTSAPTNTTPDSAIDFPTTTDAYLPLTHHDGSNPALPLSTMPHPGILIYRLTDTLTYANQAAYLDALTTAVFAHTRPARASHYARLGDRPWNDPGPRRGEVVDLDADARPVLRAVVLDFGAVANVDVTAVQGLVDVRKQLERHADAVEGGDGVLEWHFAGVGRRWTKRALAAAGFGYGAKGSAAVGTEGLFAVAEVGGASVEEVRDEKAVVGDVENGGARKRLTTVYGVNRPFFHIDLPAAVRAAVRNARKREEQHVVRTVQVDAAGKEE
ncbi:sulfate anion transporter [Lasiodiplodia theobromae]|uniref:Sulfate permease n=1 Tax=Lasiodiplodia theobromae TaxID=45133 RepID=UPI0015C330FB|nr:Sulfate permease [Lasiodiplodia theobromae]KAF4545002.1 Sulfate permease [Lasiodiplodia theobromae]KAF9631657.1 sulfate anion transporter [Lasiodiplodia theobromae]